MVKLAFLLRGCSTVRERGLGEWPRWGGLRVRRALAPGQEGAGCAQYFRSYDVQIAFAH
jgi:hypothetical protein